MKKSESAIDKEKNPWCLIGGDIGNEKSFEIAMTKQVKKETGIKIEKVEFISESRYHARLTDDNVNNIERSENQLLDFFSLSESKKLILSTTTAQFISKHSELI